jgi:hypothetical protein
LFTPSVIVVLLSHAFHPHGLYSGGDPFYVSCRLLLAAPRLRAGQGLIFLMQPQGVRSPAAHSANPPYVRRLIRLQNGFFADRF